MKNKRNIGHIKKLGEGKYLLRLSCGFDEFGKRIQPSKVVYCKNDTAAEKELIEFYKQKEKLYQEHTTGAPKTIEALYNEWYKNHVERNLSPSTQAFYKNLWERFLSDKGRAKLATFSAKTIYMIIDGVPTPRNKNAVYKMLCAMFNKAVKWGYATANPCAAVDTPQYVAEEKQALTPEQITVVAKEIEKEETKYRIAFFFAALCGLRRQEIIGLKWDDIDFFNNSFYIRRAAIYVKGKGTITKEPKTKKSARKLFLPQQLKQLLIEHKHEQTQLKLLLGDKWRGDNWVLTQADGSIMHFQTPSHWWEKFAKKNGISGVTFHGLRHTAASYMIKNNVPITTVSGVLGHANTSTTLNIYSHMLEDTKKEAINSLEKMYKTDVI